jgi:hypothetical protein
MKKYLTPILLVILILNSSILCEKFECYGRPNTKLGENRNWLPMQGRTSLQFVTDNGSIRSFPINETDTILRVSSCYNSSFNDHESLQVEMFLDTIPSLAKPEIISVKLDYENEMTVTTKQYTTMDEQNYWFYSLKNVGNYQGATPLSNFQLKNRIYPTGVLLSSRYKDHVIDSIYLAKNFGVVGFKYKKVWYFLS